MFGGSLIDFVVITKSNVINVIIICHAVPDGRSIDVLTFVIGKDVGTIKENPFPIDNPSPLVIKSHISGGTGESGGGKSKEGKGKK